MQEEDVVVGIYDEKGKMIGSKIRKEVDKRNDILRVAAILLFDEDNKVLITQPTDSLYKGKWGLSSAGIVRIRESPMNAANRTLVRELGIEAELNFLGENFYNFDGIKRVMSFFNGYAEDEIDPNPEDISKFQWVSAEELQEMIGEGQCTPQLVTAVSLVKNNEG